MSSLRNSQREYSADSVRQNSPEEPLSAAVSIFTSPFTRSSSKLDEQRSGKSENRQRGPRDRGRLLSRDLISAVEDRSRDLVTSLPGPRSIHHIRNSFAKRLSRTLLWGKASILRGYWLDYIRLHKLNPSSFTFNLISLINSNSFMQTGLQRSSGFQAHIE